MAPLAYEIPVNASLAHKGLVQYIQRWNDLDLDGVSAFMDAEDFNWVMLPESLGFPAMNKAQSIPYLRDVFIPSVKSFTFDILEITEIGDLSCIAHLKGVAESKLGSTLKNEYIIVMDFKPSVEAGGAPTITRYKEFMDSKGLSDFMAAEAKAKDALATI